MKTARIRSVLLVLTGLLITVVNVRASDPVGIYAVVDKVVFEPNEAAAERVQVWGTFSTWAERGDIYTKPQKGYLYYKFRTGSSGRVERTEWADLKAIAGTGQGVAFGQRYTAPGRIRPASEKPEGPEEYPVGMGLTKVGIGGYQYNMDRVIGEIKKAK
jgi:hypothetical protein